MTTKRAKSGDVALSYNFEYGWEIPTKLPTYVGAQRYMEMVNETRYNDNPDGGWYQTYTEDEITNWSINNATNPDKYPMTDWGDILLKSSAPRQTHTLSIVGGGKIIRTKASFRYDKTDGLYVNKEYDRFMVRVNNDFNINKYISANLDLNFSRSKALSPNSNPMGAGGRNIPPIYAATWTNGLWGDVKDGENMLAKITDGGTFTNWGTNIGGKLGIDITPVNGLKISATVAPNFNNVKKKTFVKQIPYTRSEDPNTTVGYMGGYRTTNLTENRNDSHDITTQFFANYAKTLGRHDFSVMIGYEDYYAFWENLDASRDQYQLTSYPYLDLGSEDYRDNGGNAEEYAYRSLFGRMTYSYADRYLIQANLRRDGSSRFASNCRWANFPSVSLGWVISEEKFFKNINMDWFSYLKLRGSWGKLGNERIGAYDDDGNFIYNYYPYQAAIDYSTALFQNSQGIVSSVTTAAQQKYAVRDISWETTESWDIGLDANFLDNRLHFSADYYRKNTKDMLLALEIPHFIGYDKPEVNAGNMHTTGYDIEVGWRDKVGDFTYSISANLSDFTSKMGNLNGTQFLGNQVKMEGSEYNEWYGYVSDGLFLTQEDVDKSPKLNNSVKVGDIKYKDISGPDGVPDGVISPEYDRVLLGGSLPHYMFGLTFNVAYKGWDFGLTLQGVGSQKSQISAAMIEGLRDNWLNFPTILDGNYWSPKNTDEQNATAKYPRLTRTNRDANFCMSDYWLYNGRYIRLKNLSVGYTLPKAWTTKACMNTVRLYVSGSDLFTISNAPKGWDPEVSTEGYPITTSLIFGVSINF
ncbi:SusC/RagA family TonB-linked outer membrane protein [Bacteroides thetaiotaomicron]|nr:SusC/RagA family TonB-linked outer membrane protein [Bacteroides thetaiotaomicron]